MYVRRSWSPFATLTVPPENAASDQRVPDVPDLVLLLMMNAPLSVPVPVMLNVATVPLVMLALAAAPGDHA